MATKHKTCENCGRDMYRKTAGAGFGRKVLCMACNQDGHYFGLNGVVRQINAANPAAPTETSVAQPTGVTGSSLPRIDVDTTDTVAPGETQRTAAPLVGDDELEQAKEALDLTSALDQKTIEMYQDISTRKTLQIMDLERERDEARAECAALLAIIVAMSKPASVVITDTGAGCDTDPELWEFDSKYLEPERMLTIKIEALAFDNVMKAARAAQALGSREVSE